MNGVRVAVHEFEQLERPAKIVLDDHIAIGRGGGGDRPQMDNAVELAPIEPSEQPVGGDDIRELALGEVAPLRPRAQPIADHDVAAASLIEARHHVRSDEPGSAGDQKHPCATPRRSAPLCPRVACHATWPWRAGRVACRSVDPLAGSQCEVRGQGWTGGPLRANAPPKITCSFEAIRKSLNLCSSLINK